MDFYNVLTSVVSLTLIILVGFIGRKRKILDETLTNGLSKLLINITLPLMILTTFNISFSQDILENVYKCFLFSFLIFLITIILVNLILLPIKSKEKRNILIFGNVFSNCGFIAFPIVSSILGAEGVLYTSIFNMFFTIFLWTYGVILFDNNKNRKVDYKIILKNPSIISVLIGIILMISSIQLPEIIKNTCETVGSMTTPLSMLIIGSILSTTKFSKYIKDFTIYYGSLIKLIALPLILLLIATNFFTVSVLWKTLIVLVAMPSATMTSIFATNYNKDKEYASMFVFISTIFSILTLPLIVSIIP